VEKLEFSMSLLKKEFVEIERKPNDY